MPKSWRSSWMWLMRRLERRDAEAAGDEQDVVPLHLLEREAAAERPAQSRRCRRTACACSAPVTSPALRTHSSMKPCLLTAPRRSRSAPRPRRRSTARRTGPTSNVNASRTSSSMRRNSNSFSLSVRSMIDVMRAGHGRYGFAFSLRVRPRAVRHRHAPPSAARSTTSRGLMPARHARCAAAAADAQHALELREVAPLLVVVAVLHAARARLAEVLAVRDLGELLELARVPHAHARAALLRRASSRSTTSKQ